MGLRECEPSPLLRRGSKTMGFEIIEQLGWRLPRHTVVCMASGSLLTKIHKSFTEFGQARAGGTRRIQHLWCSSGRCSPITTAIKNNTEVVKPVAKPHTIAKSLSIGTPADGYYAIRTMKETAERPKIARIWRSLRRLSCLPKPKASLRDCRWSHPGVCAKTD